MGGIHLTTPKTTGDLAEVDYNDVRVTDINLKLRDDRVAVTYQLGNFDDATGEFTPGIIGPQLFNIWDGKDQNGEPDPSVDDYTVFFDETSKQGNDSVVERYVEMATNLISLRLGLPGAAVKPGRSGKKKI